MSEKREKKGVSYRLPAELIERVRLSAARDHRCINNQVIHLLNKALEEPKNIKVKELEINIENSNAEQISENLTAALDRQNGDKRTS